MGPRSPKIEIEGKFKMEVVGHANRLLLITLNKKNHQKTAALQPVEVGPKLAKIRKIEKYASLKRS